jgi:SAM-dependent methyltransferase
MTILYLEALAAIAVSLSVLMAGAWVAQQRAGNSGWVDTIWTFSLGLVGAGSALWPVAGAVPNARQWLVAALVAIWSLRLGVHIAIRTAAITDDPRGGLNSSLQREFVAAEAGRRGLKNLHAVTSDMNVFDPQMQFDRIVSVEMFEHMTNWRELMSRVRSWLKPDGRFFMHIFTHRSGAYLFDRADGEDWIAQHFFTGGVMPSHHLIRQYADLFEVEKEWRWSGVHYQRTAQDWLANFDLRHDEIEEVLRHVYGDETALWMRRWR